MTDERSNQNDGRDAKGRWTKGKSGNPNGRSRRVPDLDMADVHNFSNHPTEITIGGEKQLMTRHEIVLFKLFESAGKGSIAAQKYLLAKFEEAEMSYESVRLELEKWAERRDEDPDVVTLEIAHTLRRASESLAPRRSMIRTRRGGKLKR